MLTKPAPKLIKVFFNTKIISKFTSMTSRHFPRHDFPYHDFPFRDYPCADYPTAEATAASKGRRQSPKAPAPGIGGAVISLLKFVVMFLLLLIKVAFKLLSRRHKKRR